MDDRRGWWIGAFAVVAVGAFLPGTPSWFPWALWLLALVLAFAPVFHYWPFSQFKAGASDRSAVSTKRRTKWSSSVSTRHSVDSEPAIRLILDAPRRFLDFGLSLAPESPKSARVEVRRIGGSAQWGPIDVPVTGPWTTVHFPRSFDAEAVWPPARGRYIVRWDIGPDTSSAKFAIDQSGNAGPTGVARTRRWLVNRVRRIHRGFPPPSARATP